MRFIPLFFVALFLSTVFSEDNSTPTPKATKDNIHLNPANNQVPVDIDQPPLVQASENGDIDHVVELLTSSSSPAIDEPNTQGWTALMKAAYYGHDRVVKVLLEHGANAAYVGGTSLDTSLILAAAQGNLEVVKVLLAHPDALAAIDSAGKGGWTPLVWAAQQGFTDVVLALLKAGASVHGAPKGASPLVAAAHRGHMDIIEALLAAGADVDRADGAGALPLGMAKDATVTDALKRHKETAAAAKVVEAEGAKGGNEL